MENRIKGQSVEIDYKDTLSFFNSRGSEIPLKHKYNYVLFQDEHPELAIERDMYEKNKIGNIINFTEQDSVLDIGCGVGRWGEEVLRKGMDYVGIDYSEQLLHVAEDNLKDMKEHCTLIHCAAQNLTEGLANANLIKPFEVIFINGVLMYLNDDDLIKCLEQIKNVINEKKCTIYIKETVATKERLTLNKFYSEDLKHDYTAIYRSIDEYKNLLVEIFVKKLGFTMTKCEDLFSEDLKNRKETKDYYFILNKAIGGL